MKKEVIISINGYGQELVQGTWTDSELKKLTNGIDETDEMEFGSRLFDLTEILPDSYDWYERDDLCHHYGELITDCTLLIEQSDKEDIQLDINEDEGIDIEYTEECNYTGKDNVITIISTEKGNMFEGIIDLDENEEFDITKLRINVTGLIFNNYENELITGVYYNNIELDNSGGDTSGKGMYAYLDKKNKI